MNIPLLYTIAGLAVFCIALYAVIMQTDPLRQLLTANIMSSGVFLVLVALARRSPRANPDPVPHAMVITGIVIAVSATALAIVLIQRLRAAGDEGAADDVARERR